MSQTKEKIKIFSKFRPFVHGGEIDVHSNFVCSLYSDSNKRLRGILENKQLYAPNLLPLMTLERVGLTLYINKELVLKKC